MLYVYGNRVEVKDILTKSFKTINISQLEVPEEYKALEILYG